MPEVDPTWNKMNRVPGAWIDKWVDGSPIGEEHILNLMSTTKVLDQYHTRLANIRAKLRLCFNAKPHYNPCFAD